MSLLERYLHEVGRYLPGKNREDILAELRSSLSDSLEGRFGSSPTDEQVATLLKETGEPRKVAASYSNSGQYLIGPDLYPFFSMVAGIVLVAVVGAQLIAFAVAAMAGDGIAASMETWLGLLSSIPSALGSVVIVFYILQRVGVKPELDKKDWDPMTLPQVSDDQKIKRGDHIVGIIFGSIFIAILAIPERIGLYQSFNGPFFVDPILMQYAYLLILALTAGIALDAYMLWQGRWTLGSRVARIAVNLFQIGILSFFLNAHTAWLTSHGAGGFLPTLESLTTGFTGNLQLFTMETFRLVFLIALVVTVIQTIVELVKLVRLSLSKTQATL
jgi:hypothetical protein